MNRILIADDKEENRFIIRNFLKLLGPDSMIEYFEAISAKDVLEKIPQVNPDLIFMDIKMESEDAGIKALEIIKANPDYKSIKVWALTAKQIDIKEMSKKAKFDDLIMKPFDIAEMLTKVSEFFKIQIPENVRAKMINQ